jgi:DNA-directed RNA polymerase subunit M/transcription elongation factor TFIIS
MTKPMLVNGYEVVWNGVIGAFEVRNQTGKTIMIHTTGKECWTWATNEYSLSCPDCDGDMVPQKNVMVCKDCGRHYLISDGKLQVEKRYAVEESIMNEWANTWGDEIEVCGEVVRVPTSFASREEAEQEVKDHIETLLVAVDSGDMVDALFDRDNYRIVELY